MNKGITEALPGLILKLEKEPASNFQALFGFDACIDNVANVVKGKDESNQPLIYDSSRDFGEFIVGREEKSCGIELRTKISKPGGNMVITGNALGNLGVYSDCIGSFGFPVVLPAFKSMSDKCRLHSIGETITTTALEFKDAKIMMSDLGPYEKLSWEGIKNQMGIDTIRRLFEGKQLLALLNWSEIENTSSIWKGILKDVLPHIAAVKTKPFLLIDLSDCSRKTKYEIRQVADLIGEFTKYFHLIFSMNQNEAEMLASSLEINAGEMNESFLHRLHKACSVDEIAIHLTEKAISYNGEEFADCPTFFCKNPAILTGGGDNFNAGYCYAKLRNFTFFESLLIGNSVSGYYVKSGESPSKANLISFLKESK